MYVQGAVSAVKGTISETAIQQFKTSLRGDLLRPDEPGYEESRTVWNAMIDRKPALVVRCLGVADVVTSVNWARDHNLPLCIKGGGHNIAGLAVCDGGLLLDMSRMRGVWVDPTRRIARAQAGCLLGDVDRETQLHGLGVPLGFVSNTGIAGLTVGGGFGYLTRRFGWTCDNLSALEVVTSDGRIVRASEKENSDLFWGFRGGGGNFGVVTNFEYNLHPVGPEVYAGAIAWRAEDAPAVLEMYQRLVQQAPPELVCVAAMRMAPPAPWLPKEMHGRPIVMLIVCYTGSIQEGEKLVAPIKAFGSPVGDIVQRRLFVSQQSLIDATQPKGRRNYWKSDYLGQVEPGLVTKMIENAKHLVSPHSLIILFPLDGALNQHSEDYSPAGNRDARAVINIVSSWEKPEDDKANVEWARSVWRDIHPFSTGRAYVNFMTEEEGEDRIQNTYGKNYKRLAEVKSRWDPGNLFRMNKNIPPLK